MALTLFLLRHAKTQPAGSGESDFDRPLYKEGVSQSIRLGHRLAELNIHPEVVVGSPAKRAKDTLLNVIPFIGITEQEIHFNELIYTGDTEDLLEFIRATDDQYKSVLLTGHNPSITSLASYLVRSFNDSMSPCDFIQIDFDLPGWNLLSKRSGTLKNILSGSSL